VLVLVFGWPAAPAFRAFAQTWRVQVEEPTGLYPRTNELVAVPYSKIGGRREAWQVSDSNGNELAWQATENGLLFPVTLIPVSCHSISSPLPLTLQIILLIKSICEGWVKQVGDRQPFFPDTDRLPGRREWSKLSI
jgi:hypothetical protein